MSKYTEQIKSIQTELQNAKLYKGAIDGLWGNGSHAALIQHLKNGGDVKLSANIHLSEVLKSQTASRQGIDNTPSMQVFKNIVESAVNLWQPVRDLLGVPILISSGYRTLKLNRAIRSKDSSAHTAGYAIDFSAPSFGSSTKIVNFLKGKLPAFDQLILEYPNKPNSWVHLGYKSKDGKQRKSVFRIG